MKGVIDVHFASLTSQGLQLSEFYQDGHPSRYQPRPTGLNSGEQTGTGVLVTAVDRVIFHNRDHRCHGYRHHQRHIIIFIITDTCYRVCSHDVMAAMLEE